MTAISEKYINGVIDNSDNPALVEDIISNHFSGLDRPCSISISVKSLYDDNSSDEGLKTKEEIFDNDILRIVNMLRENGIDAVPYNSAEAADISRFVVDRSGIISPMMTPEDAIQATADIAGILEKNNEDIKGFVFPKTKENLTYYTNQKDNDFVKNNENSALAKQISDEYGMTVEQFSDHISKEIQKLPEVDVDSKTENRDYSTCFRGGTFGSNPYAVLTDRRSKDCAYYTPVMDTALGYSHGIGNSIGFIAEVQTSDDQKFYGDWSLETRGKEVSKLKDAYETLGLAYKNPVKAMYMVKGGKTYQIANENGFISKEMELFAKLYDGKSLAANEIMYQRGNTLKELADTDINKAVASYDKSSKLEPFSLNLKASAKEYIQQNFLESSTSVMADGKYAVNDNVVFGSHKQAKENIDTFVPDCVKDINFKHITIINAKVTDTPALDNVKNLTLSSCFVENSKNIPNDAVLKYCTFNKETDFSHLKSVEFIGRSLSDNSKLPEKVTLNKVALGNNIDFSRLKELNLKNMHIDTIKTLKLPERISLDNASFEKKKTIQLSKLFKKDKNKDEKIDLGKIKELNLKNMHIDSVKTLKLPEKITLDNISFKEKETPKWLKLFKRDKNEDKKIDLGKVKELNLKDFTLDDLNKLKISKDVKIQLSGAITIKDPSTLALLEKYNVDFKDVTYINLFAHKRFINEAKKDKIKLPDDIPLVWKNNDKLEVISKEENKEILYGHFDNSSIKKATFKTPEELKQTENMTLHAYLPASDKAELTADNSNTKEALKEVENAETLSVSPQVEAVQQNESLSVNKEENTADDAIAPQPEATLSNDNIPQEIHKEADLQKDVELPSPQVESVQINNNQPQEMQPEEAKSQQNNNMGGIIHEMRMGNNPLLEQPDNSEQKTLENETKSISQEIEKEAPQAQNDSVFVPEGKYGEAAIQLVENRTKSALERVNPDGAATEQQKEDIMRRKEHEMQMTKTIAKVMEEKGPELFSVNDAKAVEKILKEQALKDGLLKKNESALFGESIGFSNGAYYNENECGFYSLAVGIATQKMESEMSKAAPEQQKDVAQMRDQYYNAENASKQAAFAMSAADKLEAVSETMPQQQKSNNNDIGSTLYHMRMGQNSLLESPKDTGKNNIQTQDKDNIKQSEPLIGQIYSQQSVRG